LSSAPRYMAALKGSLKLFDEWYGPYPYSRITVVDPPHGGSDAGGMEYPTLITADTSWNMPKGALIPEVVVEHEFGHQYWYGMVATNEFEEAWLDEGINSYTEVKVMDELYGRNTSVLNFPFAQLGEDEQQRLAYLSRPDTDPITRFAWQFYGSNAYGGITYGKTATVLLTLEKIIGEDTMRRALHTYFMRFRFTHPTGEDFLKTIEEVSGKNVRWYFDQAVYGTNILDYEILNAHSDRVNWYEKKSSFGDDPKDKDQVYRTYVSVHRKGDFVFPVDVEIKFTDGQSVLEHWDGRDRWIRYVYERRAKIQSAEIDPQHQVLLDRDVFNNSYVAEENPQAVHKLAHLWLFANEWLAQLISWIT
jgi:aminopeptidase N